MAAIVLSLINQQKTDVDATVNLGWSKIFISSSIINTDKRHCSHDNDIAAVLPTNVYDESNDFSSTRSPAVIDT